MRHDPGLAASPPVLTVGRAADNQPDDRELRGGQLRPVRRGRVRAPACPLRAAVAEQAADTCRVSFGARGGLQPKCLVQVADRLVLHPFREQPAGILKRRRADQRPRVPAVCLDSGQGREARTLRCARATFAFAFRRFAEPFWQRASLR